MGLSSQAINTATITTNTNSMVTGLANAPANVVACINEIVTKFNATLETVTGHAHDGTTSAKLVGGRYSMDEFRRLIEMGVM